MACRAPGVFPPSHPQYKGGVSCGTRRERWFRNPRRRVHMRVRFPTQGVDWMGDAYQYAGLIRPGGSIELAEGADE